MYRPNEQQRAGYIVASERCIGTAVGLPIPATAQNLIGTEPIRRGAAETNSGYAPQKSCSWLIRAAARRGRAAVSAAPRKASPAFRLWRSAYRSAAKARVWSDGLSREACSSGCREFPRSRIVVFVRRRFRCAAVGCVCPPAVPRCPVGCGVPAPVCVSPRRSSRSDSAPPMRSSAFAPPIFCERCAAAPNAAGFLRLAQAAGGMAFTGRFSDAERSLSAPV